LLGSLGAPAISRLHAPRQLARLLPGDQLEREVRVACLGYFEPSLVFYCHRRVEKLLTAETARQFLEGPLPSYLIMPAQDWQIYQTQLGTGRSLGQRYDFYVNKNVLVIANGAAQQGATGR
jgi:hypothetical protein